MLEIHVARRFVLTHKFDGEGAVHTRREFLPGKHEVGDDVASHWFVTPHLVTDDPVRQEQFAAEAALLTNAHGSRVVVPPDALQLQVALDAALGRAEAAEAEARTANQHHAEAVTRAEVAERALEAASAGVVTADPQEQGEPAGNGQGSGRGKNKGNS